MTLQRFLLTVSIWLGFAGVALAQEPTPTASPSPSASPTPFPPQEGTGVPPGYDEAIGTPTPAATPDPFAGAMPPDHDDFLRPEDPEQKDGWDPKKPFPGNYYALPLTLDVGWRPCLTCSGEFYSRPGAVTVWLGGALQPHARISAPFVAGGVEAVVASFDEGATTWEGRWQVTPTVRSGWNFSAASVYAVGGVILPGEDRKKAGYHAGVGVSSFAFMVLAACTAEAIPSVVEIGVDVTEDPVDDRMRSDWALKIAWGF